MDPFDQSASDFATAFGDPTRRAVYLAASRADAPVSVSRVAEAFDLHPNVARYHLDNLAKAGYLRVTKAPPRSGRPAHLYQPTDREIHIDLPSRNLDLLARLLVKTLQRVTTVDVSAVAYDVGRAHGEELVAGSPTEEHGRLGDAIRSAAGIMENLGFEIDVDSPGCGYRTRHCPFGDLALENPAIVCALDRGLVAGLLKGLGRVGEVAVHPHTTAAESCVTEVSEPG